MHTGKAKSVMVALLALGVLAACGPMPEATPPAATDAAPTSPASPAPGGGLSASTPESTPRGPLTFGDLADRVEAAWPEVKSYRVTFTGTALRGEQAPGTPLASPVATPGATPVARLRGAYTTVRDVVMPDRQRQSVAGLGADDHEAIAIGDTLYVRGPVVERIAPGASESAWIELDPSSLPEGAALLHLLGGLPEIPGAPLATLPERLRQQQVRELQTVQHDGRECQVFAAADTVPATGMRVDYTIAIDENNIPCFLETGAGGVTQGRDDYTEINADLAISAPAAATPVGIPPELATPVAHD